QGGAGALEGGDDDGPRGRWPGGGQDRRRRVRNLLEPGLDHGEDTDLLGRAKAVLGRAEDAELLPPLAFQVQHGVNDMLQDPGSGDGTVFRHMAAQEYRRADL